MNKSKAGHIKLIILSLTCIAVIVMAAVIPEKLIDYNAASELSQAYKDQTSSSYAISESLSLNLTDDEKMQLICNVWESNVEVVDFSSSNISSSEADIIKNLNSQIKKTLAPNYRDFENEETFFNDSRPYYTYNIVLYKCTDSVFNAYYTYFWGITYTRYDNSRTYEFLFTDFLDIIYFSRNDTDDKSTENIYARYCADFEECAAQSFAESPDSTTITEAFYGPDKYINYIADSPNN